MVAAHAVDLANKLEILFGGEEIDKETLVNISSYTRFPVFALGRVGSVDGDGTPVGVKQVKDESEECGLAGTIVADESEDISVVDKKRRDVYSCLFAELLQQVFGFNHIIGDCVRGSS